MRCGVDLVHVPRVQRLLADNDFLDSVWTDAEQRYCGSDPNRWAGRWAAKEAVLKLLEVGVDDIQLSEIEVVGSGPVTISLRGLAYRRAQSLRIDQISLSISHDGDMAVALAVA